MYSSLISARGGFGAQLLQLQAGANWASASLLFNVRVKDDAHGPGLETQTQLRPR